ncbi:mechanosensitive ion channel family protein [Massilia antarctica]|uniref:mechanosensitive ion channel family protein n=1 Tax=Massilia antarctica TaxID=2765360 RepID=UPI0006BC49C0|nr:mechanosensitive ion channel family protein [Massilia sp. H27-R4]MCY0914751.1 mechanosensitive ion channel family protein [Massilia sp. H27-R4]CUI08212.1 Potassium efflux system KefA protein / Small-conductance mechanosensitive channel [Janthinobacterium sp. CG23_2]CUU31998.1 Potassium efflux system KefA protein / Small-conductance mechanosensitive channel [Janthinobacterium sp. CG23_2]
MNIHAITFPLAGISPANWLLATAVAVGSYVILHGAVVLFRRHLAKLSEQGRADRPAAELLKATLARTSKLALVVTALLLGLTVLDLGAPWDERVRHLWFIALGAQLALYLDRALSVGAQRYFRSRASAPEAPATVANTLMVWVLKTVLWVVFLLAVLSNLGIDVSTLVASLGIGGIAVALAVQNILGDLFASLSIAVDKPFEVGDSISVAGFSGNVEHVGLKTTRIRSDSGEQIVIANAELLKNTLRNFKRMSTRRVQFSLRANPSTTTAQAAQVPAALRAIIEAQEGVRYDRVHLKSVTQEALEFDVVFHVLDPSYGRYMDVQQTILLAAMEAFEQLGVSTVGASRHVLIERVARAANATPAAPVKPGAALHNIVSTRKQPA